KLRERERLDKVIVGSLVQPLHAIFDCVACRQYEHRGLQSTLSQRGQHLKTIAAWKHEIQDDKVEFLRIHQKKTFFSCWSDDHLVFLALQSFAKRPCNLAFVFDNQNSQIVATSERY